jgi:hypothetical protein
MAFGRAVSALCFFPKAHAREIRQMKQLQRGLDRLKPKRQKRKSPEEQKARKSHAVHEVHPATPHQPMLSAESGGLGCPMALRRLLLAEQTMGSVLTGPNPSLIPKHIHDSPCFA